jgi:chromate transporter
VRRRPAWLEVLAVSLRLGLTSFGGPVAHLGYQRRAFVEQRGWLDDRAFGELVALCQALPGPGSSQLSLAVGRLRAGWPGALAAWVGFTLPSAVLMALLGVLVAGRPLPETGPVAGAVAGLKAAAVAVVAQALVAMAGRLAPDAPRRILAAAAAVVALAVPVPAVQPGLIVAGALVGWLAFRGSGPGLLGERGAAGEAAGSAGTQDAPGDRPARDRAEHDGSVGAPSHDDPAGAPSHADPAGAARHAGGPRTATALATAWVILVAAALLLGAVAAEPGIRFFAALVRAGALVFGGGHVVLPLLDAGVVAPGWVAPDAFLGGYGAAQAVPGPLFSFGAYLGAVSSVGPGGFAGAAIGTTAIFLPGMLLLLAALPVLRRLRDRPAVAAALAGTNAAVVGVLAAALVTPVGTGGLTSIPAVVLAVLGFLGLASGRVAPLVVVAACAGMMAVLAAAGVRV